MPRSIIIGDVHGCSDELTELLECVAPGPSDRVVFVGDLVGRGPDPRGVIALATSVGAVAVQGNHERHLLEVHASGPNGRKSRLGPGHRRMMASFSETDWRFMEAMPLYFELPAHDVCVVHAGIDPRRSLHDQDPWVLTHIRSFDEQSEPCHRDGQASWAASYQGPIHVAFGHNAMRGLQLHEHATGLDSGCVYGGALTALVLDEGAPVLPVASRSEQLVRVAAKRQYFDPNL